ncbi:hypothetical protein HPB49_018881 [Dermacentor silvarum]|uniref:Uncharacterized protein n=1 Tax=Dermacentor silvarum TaxID=543639 RepID=A0ACB8DFA2_DERSI|nr:hypothetical protein HPB49_018881 [Dermacentor silvarum]
MHFRRKRPAQTEAATPTDGPVVLETVVALYSFASQNEEELSFTKGEQLEVIEKPENDPDWWKARNQSGDTGLVPKNYVQVVVAPTSASTTPKPSTPVPQPAIAPRPELHAKEWYFGSISRSQCDQVLNDHAVDGDFLIRDSETNVGDLSVSLKAPQRNKHFRVHVEDAGMQQTICIA